tara:strand:- start:76 stop:306 length:231 start_codon:yes stop_codon:yes gene_type:complete
MSELMEKQQNPSIITIFIKKPIQTKLKKWLFERVTIVDIDDKAIGINFDYDDLLTIAQKLEVENLTPNNDFLVISS